MSPDTGTWATSSPPSRVYTTIDSAPCHGSASNPDGGIDTTRCVAVMVSRLERAVELDLPQQLAGGRVTDLADRRRRRVG
jgi:hypothetical protein